MLGFRRYRKRSVLDEPIGNILTRMNEAGLDSQKYNECVDHLDRLMEMKTDERKHRIDPNTVLIVLGNLLGILVIVIYEQKHVMVSRALGFVNRTEPRIK
jgi:hypothetical protein